MVKTIKNKRLTLLMRAISVILFVFANSIQAVPVSELFEGSSFFVYDKEFYDWTLLTESRVRREDGNDNPVDTGVDYSEIDVQVLSDNPLNPGLRYVASSNSGLDVSAPDGSSATEILDVAFAFKVRTLDGSERIKDNTLELLEFSGSSIFTLNITETLGGSQGGVGAKEVYARDIDDGLESVLFDMEVFTPQSFLFVTTTIRMAAASQGPDRGSAVLESFEQRFSQVPEPATLALMGLGLAGIGYQRRRQIKMA